MESLVTDDAYLQRLVSAIEAQQATIERLVEIIDNEQRQRTRPGAKPAGTGPDQPGPRSDTPQPSVVNWERVRGRERLIAWRDLSAFVEVLVVRYGLQLELRPCWWQHPDAVEELTALWHIKQHCYRAGAELVAPMMWMDNLAKIRARLRIIFIPCKERHVDATVPMWMPDRVRAEFFEAVRADVYDAPEQQPQPG
jgi:hypothetical protein